MVLNTVQQLGMLNIDNTLNSQEKPHTPPSRATSSLFGGNYPFQGQI